MSPPTHYQFSQGKLIRFLFMQPLHLRQCVLPSIRLLFLMQHHPHNHALYEVSVRRLEYLPPASFSTGVLWTDSSSQRTPLLLANDKYCNSRSGLAPYSVMNMPDTHKKPSHFREGLSANFLPDQS